ncbi:MAG: hypothetical protein JXA49_02100, partial [Actinobacteria bacterium]|nr:hypothetical protein [Actinomycetota bacterium]
PQIALDSSGNPNAVWYGDDGPTDQIYYSEFGNPAVTTATTSNIGRTTASSGGNVTSDGGYTVSARGVCWSTNPNPTTADNHTTDGTGTGDFTSSLTGLSPGTLYHVRAYATNSFGTVYGSDKSFATEPPTPTTWYLAEGSTAWGFSEYISIENPNDASVQAEITYNTEGGPVSGGTLSLPPMSQTTVNPVDTVPNRDFSTYVEVPGGQTIAVDRTMQWTGEGALAPEAHSSIGVTSPSETWYLPEGSSAWGFECWLLIQNPGGAEATCEVTYMIEGADPVTLEKKVPAGSRKTYNMADDIGAHDASIKVTSNVPVIPERAMYRCNRREGHDSIGTTAPARDYYLAEGAVGYDSGYVTYVLIQNPHNETNRVTVTYLTGSGEAAGPTIDMAPNSRKTIKVNDDFPNAADVSTTVHGEKPIIAERAMYWNSPAGEACHDSIGMSAPHSAFFLPDGQTTEGRETWTLIANPNNEDIPVRVHYLPEGGGTPVWKDEMIPANSRCTFNMADHSGISGRASVLVTGGFGKKMMVERAMYWNDRAAGTDTTGGYSD